MGTTIGGKDAESTGIYALASRSTPNAGVRAAPTRKTWSSGTFDHVRAAGAAARVEEDDASVRTPVRILVSLGAAALVGSVASAGCGTLPDDCELLLACDSGATGGGGSTPPECIPSENKDPVDDTCGVFVSSSLGADGNEGTKSAPLKTLQQAIEKANGRPVYACAEELAGSVTLARGGAIYGGLDCTKQWAYVGGTKKSALIGEADKPALTLEQNASWATMADLTIQAADAETDGGSSIAMVVDGAKAVGLMRCDLIAGNGKAGVAGETPMDPLGPTDPNDPGIKGNNGQKACTDMVQQLGGAPKENVLCPAISGGPLGGAGGIGSVASGGDGSSGTPPVAGKGAGGKGETFVGWDCSADGTNGGGAVGANGGAGTAGAGAKGDSALGTIDSVGYTGVPGNSGGNGSPGQGGGGGGGAKGKLSCAGASGGGGGAGGGGGKGGGGGHAGGSSIGLISLHAALTVDSVSINVGTGGNGGEGANGQIGGAGGKGGSGGIGSGTLNACDGGNGGQGGTGGKGGGGRGGHAIGIAYTGTSMPTTKGVTFTQGTPGAGGKGADAMHNGDPGIQADVQAFP
jgi:hypothetical protein